MIFVVVGMSQTLHTMASFHQGMKKGVSRVKSHCTSPYTRCTKRVSFYNNYLSEEAIIFLLYTIQEQCSCTVNFSINNLSLS